MKYWSRFPVFRVLIPFASGILFCINTNQPVILPLIVTIISAFVSWLFTVRNYATGKFANRWLAGIPIYLYFFGLGYIVTWYNKPVHYNDHFTVNSKESFYIIRVKRPPVETPKGFRIIAEVTTQQKDSAWLGCRGNLLMYVKDTAHFLTINTGDKLLVNARLEKLKPPLNPGAFDYSKFLESKGISYQCFPDRNSIEILEKNARFNLFETADRFRKSLLNILNEYLEGQDRLGVAGALLLGYEEWLDPELENQYSAAGVLHILCVSGMHVGLIYIILSWMLSWMKKNRFLHHLQFPLMISLIWFYSMVTGLAPSIIRAATMISFMIAGKWLDKNSSIYNTLCSSCVVMFAFDPFLIVSAGFQLSFLAVCGIVIFHKMIFPLWSAPNTFLHKTWELVSISVAAQLSTFPLSLFLFHQFPNYFLVGNLILIPLSTFVMYAGILLLTTSWIPFAGMLTGYLTSLSIDLLNFLVVFISELPGAVTQNISISFLETILIYLLMFAFTLWLVVKTRTWMFSWMLVLIAFLTLRIFALIEASETRIFTVYHHKNSSIYSIIENRKATIFTDPDFSQRQLQFTVSGHFMQAMVIDTTMIPLDSSGIKYIGSEQLLLIRDWPSNSFPVSDLVNKPVKILVLGGKIAVNADTVLKYFKPEIIVLDGSIQTNRIKRLTESFSGKGVKVHAIKTAGAFSIDL